MLLTAPLISLACTLFHPFVFFGNEHLQLYSKLPARFGMFLCYPWAVGFEVDYRPHKTERLSKRPLIHVDFLEE